LGKSATDVPGEFSSGTTVDREAHAAAEGPLDFMNFTRSLMRLKFETHLAGTDTNSKQVAAEIVHASYSDLLLAVRIAAFWVAGSESVSGSRGLNAASSVTLRRAGAPEDLVDQVRELRNLSKDVADGREILSSTGAGKYVRSAQSAADEVLLWAVDQLKRP
jgi:hypothetical protein